MDDRLLNALSEGDRGAFDTLVRLFYPRLMGYARIMIDEEEAKDVVQDVFHYVYEHRSQLNFNPAFGNYLFRMCYTRVVDRLRRRKFLPDDPQQTDRLLEDELNWMNRKNNDIVATLSRQDLMERVEELIAGLPAARRKVFRLSFMHDMSNAEISETLSMPRRTVESHLYLALKFLRERLDGADMLILMLLLAHQV